MARQNIASYIQKVLGRNNSTKTQSPYQTKQAVASGATSDVSSAVLGGRSYEGESTGVGKRVTGETEPKAVGWIHSDGIKLADEYKIRISSTALNTVVVGAMQEKTMFRITSDWESFIPIGGLTQHANAITQLVSGRALVSRFSSRRSWKGTSPVTLNIELKFESIENTYRNVIAPVLALMQMALPGAGVLLKPPGPDPFRMPKKLKSAARSISSAVSAVFSATEVQTAGLKNTEFKDEKAGGDWITVKIGNYLEFTSVIIKSVTPVFDTKMSVDGGYPVSANVNVEIESYEILTKETLSDAFLTKG